MSILDNVQVESGRYFSMGEDQNRRQIAFIGADLKDKFFPDTDP